MSGGTVERHLKRLHVTVADSSPIISFWIAHMTAGNARGD